MLLYLEVIPKIKWFLKLQLLVSKLLPKGIVWDDLNDLPELNGVIHGKATYSYIIGASVLVMVKYSSIISVSHKPEVNYLV